MQLTLKQHQNVTELTNKIQTFIILSSNSQLRLCKEIDMSNFRDAIVI